MQSQLSFADSFKNIFRTPLLVAIFLACAVIAGSLAGYSRWGIMPVFSNLLIRNIEKEAERTAIYLSAILLGQEPYEYSEDGSLAGENNELGYGFSERMFNDSMIERIQEAEYYLQLEKLKIFDAGGKIVYSTAPGDVGEVNTKPYFLNQVVKGHNFMKVVQKNDKSQEGRVLEKDVAEVYIPLMVRAKFKGALEIYYDITQRKEALDLLVSKTLIVINSLSLVFLLFVGFVLIKASRQMIRRKMADEKLKDVNKNLEMQVRDQTEEIRQTQKVSVKALATLAEYYDADTGEHLNRIQAYVTILTRWLIEHSSYRNYLNTKPSYLADIRLACLLHDVGKTAIPVEILTKSGKLNEEEFEIVKTHTTIAGEALTSANDDFRKAFQTDSYLALARNIALYHHEKWNGRGYPKGLSGELIPLSARIVAVADVYDALVTRRPYKEPWTHEDAANEIIIGKGEHFDPEIIEAFVSCQEDYQQVSERLKPDTSTRQN